MAGIASRIEGYVVVITNGPPDNKTFDRRRVDPSAGCRTAAEPATVPVRWSVRSFDRQALRDLAVVSRSTRPSET